MRIAILPSCRLAEKLGEDGGGRTKPTILNYLHRWRFRIFFALSTLGQPGKAAAARLASETRLLRDPGRTVRTHASSRRENVDPVLGMRQSFSDVPLDTMIRMTEGEERYDHVELKWFNF